MEAGTGIKKFYSINDIQKIGQICAEKMKLDHLHTQYTRINSKWIKCLHTRLENIKILEENIGSKIPDIPHSNIFCDICPEACETKEQIKKWDYIKLKSFCTVTETINKMKREPTL